jgi:hypothetical protein
VTGLAHAHHLQQIEAQLQRKTSSFSMVAVSVMIGHSQF